MKAILIARVSTEEQKEAGLSLLAQEARLEKYCQNKGLTVLKSFSFDESAYKNQREEFDRILDFVLEQQDTIAVCFDKVDRLSRNVFDKRVSLLYNRALTGAIELHFVSDGQTINSNISAVEKFQFGMSLGLAKYYSDAISDNVKRAYEQKLRKGEWPGPAPRGYTNVTKPDGKKDIIVDEYMSRIVQKAFELYGTGAYSMDLLCQKINTDYGVKWSKGSIESIFKNHFYYGIMVCKGVKYQHAYPPLITKTLFDQVQAHKAGFNKKPYRYAGKPYIYRSMIRCGHCGLSITPEQHKGFVYYHCTQYNGKHGGKWLREEEITRQLGAIFKRLQMPKEVYEQTIESLNQVHHDKVEFQTLHFNTLTEERKKITARCDRLYMDRLDGRITESDYDRYYQTFRDQLVDIDTRLSMLQEAEDNYYITAKHFLAVCFNAYDLFLSSEVDEKRQLLKLILSNLTLVDENLHYEGHKPFDLVLKYGDCKKWLHGLSTLRRLNWKSIQQNMVLLMRPATPCTS